MERKNNNKQNPLEDDWVIKMIDASQKVVEGYEHYLMDKIGHRELATRMTKLRDLLPDGFKDKDNKKDND